ncbi:MAG: Uma2 family endonuclease, partial [Nitrospirae bacterium]
FISNQRADIVKTDGVYGPPDLVVEILSPSTAAYDLREKFQVYERTGVKEYWIVDPEANRLTQYNNKSGQFFLIAKVTPQEYIRSSVLENLKISAQEIFKE